AYVRTIGRYPIFYGSLAAVALLMLWLWLSSFLVLLGSEVNLQIEGTRKTIAPPSIHWPKGWHLRRPIAASPSKQPTNNNDAAPPAADPIESPSGANEPGGS
ncbi:MAG TPA: YhjD/YihY/BrkB family envelope integrity protein, partial [Polyangiaceae bacterium]|nr:YhjD/YihY/BrkB family envelope integrity protein [Polyangiaceae bacterium]